jgi:hypothetical protein
MKNRTTLSWILPATRQETFPPTFEPSIVLPSRPASIAGPIYLQPFVSAHFAAPHLRRTKKPSRGRLSIRSRQGPELVADTPQDKPSPGFSVKGQLFPRSAIVVAKLAAGFLR